MLTPTGLLITVPELQPAIDTYTRLGFAIKFRDGSRYCALHGNGQKLSLLAEGESLAVPLALGIKTDDFAASLAELLIAGWRLVTPAHDGAHERSALLHTDGGTPVVLHEPL